MSYSVKWVADNLGITRDMLRYYEKEHLLPANENRNYRNYSDEDIEKIWGIKLLIGIGFSAKEIYGFMNEPDFDFDAAMSKKVIELEKKHSEIIRNLEFAKSIKLMGRIPTVSKIDSIRFDDFLASVRKDWIFYNDPHIAPFMQLSDTLISKMPQEWSLDDAEHLLKVLENLNSEEMLHTFILQGYFRVISDMRDLPHDDELVQRVVRLLHEYLVEHNTEPDFDGKITPQFIARYTAPFFISGDVVLLHERNYGKEGCQFIANALAHYGGYDIEDL